MTKRNILVADDEETIRSLLSNVLNVEGYQTEEATSGPEVLSKLAQSEPDLLLMDIRMPGLDGMEVLQKMKEGKIDVPVILITGHGTASIAIKAIQMGAFDYITKPFELDEVLVTIRRSLEYRDLSREVEKLREKADADAAPAGERIIGNSAKMQSVYKTIGRVAAADATVLLTGETGTGKELVARTIHYNSGYRHGPLITVACSSLPETLLESELFGHEKGSFTSAIAQKKGRFELAHKGTIFLDEIGEMTLSTQKKLLRVLQEREFERVGGTTPIKVDCRVIAATNRDLREEVAKGTFREDLYYRLNVIHIHLPPLRERREDIPTLVQHFLAKHRPNPGMMPPRITEEAMKKLVEYDWPGNVRQLENIVQRALVMARNGLITDHALNMDEAPERKFVDIEHHVREKMPLKKVLADVERQMILEALHQAKGNRSQAAATLGIYRRLLYAKLREYGITDS